MLVQISLADQLELDPEHPEVRLRSCCPLPQVQLWPRRMKLWLDTSCICMAHQRPCYSAILQPMNCTADTLVTAAVFDKVQCSLKPQHLLQRLSASPFVFHTGLMSKTTAPYQHPEIPAKWTSGCTGCAQTVTAFLEKYVDGLLAEIAPSAQRSASPKLPLVRAAPCCSIALSAGRETHIFGKSVARCNCACAGPSNINPTSAEKLQPRPDIAMPLQVRSQHTLSQVHHSVQLLRL